MLQDLPLIQHQVSVHQMTLAWQASPVQACTPRVLQSSGQVHQHRLLVRLHHHVLTWCIQRTQMRCKMQVRKYEEWSHHNDLSTREQVIQLSNQGYIIQSMHQQHQEWAINLSAYTEFGQQYSSRVFQPYLELQSFNKSDLGFSEKLMKLSTTLLFIPKANSQVNMIKYANISGFYR